MNDNERCPARSKQTGERCGNRAGKGTDHVGYGCCRHHGGASPTYRKRVQELMAREAVERLGLQVEIEPQRALLEELARANGAVLFLEAKLAELGMEELVVTPEEHTQSTGVQGDTDRYSNQAEPVIWYTLWVQQRTMMRQAAEAAVRAGAIDRQLALAEEQGAIMGRMLRAAIGVLPQDYQAQAFAAMRAQLSLVRGEVVE